MKGEVLKRIHHHHINHTYCYLFRLQGHYCRVIDNIRVRAAGILKCRCTLYSVQPYRNSHPTRQSIGQQNREMYCNFVRKTKLTLPSGIIGI